MPDIDDLSEEELLELLRKVHKAKPEEPYHPDSLMALAAASPKEARRILKARQTPFQRGLAIVLCSILFIVFSGVFIGLLSS